MRKLFKILLFVVSFATISVTLPSCGGDEPDSSQNEQNPSDNSSDSENQSGSQDQDQNEQIRGSKILGTWYYLNPNKALKVTITFTEEKSLNFSTFGTRICYISIESEFPYDHRDYDNVWSYDNSEWRITNLNVIPGAFSASISNVFDNEMWLDSEFFDNTQRLKFTRNDPGSPVKPTGLSLAPDGVFGKYLWHTSIGSYNITIQMTNSNYFHETSDSDVSIKKDTDGNYTRTKEHDSQFGFRNGYFHFYGILSSVLDCCTVVVIKETDKKLMFYNPFKPDVKYYFTRS